MAKARNMFLEGKHKGKFIIKTINNEISIVKGFCGKEILNDTISKIEITSQEQSKDVGSSVARGIVGGLLLGPVGVIAGAILGKQSNVNILIIYYYDGEKSLVEVDKQVYDKFISLKWWLENSENNNL